MPFIQIASAKQPWYRCLLMILFRTSPNTIRSYSGILIWTHIFAFLALSGIANSGTPIEQDPNGFFDIQWGTPLSDRTDLKEIDVANTLHVYTLKEGSPQLEGIPLDSVKLYGIDDQYTRALFHYKGAATHQSLLTHLEQKFGKRNPFHGGRMQGLNQQYTWRGPDTEISITYHGFRERGFLIAESRVLAPRFLDVHGDDSF